jgi:hypothetical protein
MRRILWLSLLLTGCNTGHGESVVVQNCTPADTEGSKSAQVYRGGTPEVARRCDPPAHLKPPTPEEEVDRWQTLQSSRISPARDWGFWKFTTGDYREQLKAKVTSLPPIHFDDAGRKVPHPIRFYPLSAPGFPLVEINAAEQLRHVYDPSSLDQFRKDKPVVRASRWLRGKGIDLILVPVPKMTEVYIEHFIDGAPAIIAPHVRQTIDEMIADDVEVVDLFPLFRQHRKEWLYNTVDRHWSPAGQNLAAKEVAQRLKRYGFARRDFALERQPYTVLPSFQATTAPGAMPEQEGWAFLTPAQRILAEKVQTRYCEVPIPNEDDPASPVLLIGNSYVPNFREQLIRQAGTLIRTHWRPAETTESFADFVREPEMLEGVRVVVWVTTNWHLTHFKPLPEEVR